MHSAQKRRANPVSSGPSKASKQDGKIQSGDAMSKSQPGLFFYKPTYGKFITVDLRGDAVPSTDSKKLFLSSMQQLLKYSRSLDTDQSRARILVGVNPKLWDGWFPNKGYNLEQRPESSYLIDGSTKFKNGGNTDVFFYLKSDSHDDLEKLSKKMHDIYLGKLRKLISYEVLPSVAKNSRVIEGRFQDGLENTFDVESLERYILTGPQTQAGRNGALGGTYCFTQKFKFSWSLLNDMQMNEKEDMIGRKVNGCIIPMNDERSHIKRARVLNEKGQVAHKLYRQSLPYGISETGLSREEGVYFVAFCNTLTAIQDVLRNLAGSDPNFTDDKLISNVDGLEGSFWYMPSAEELDPNFQSPGAPDLDLLEHWNVKPRTNRYMFYNSAEYMHRMSTGAYVDKEDIPSSRVLKLLDNTFAQWRNRWYVKPVVPEYQHLQNYAHRFLDDPDDFYQLSIPSRKGYANKMTLGVAITEEDYGKKADLFRIFPDEIIVGVMPHFSLGLGKVVMPYLSEIETEEAFSVYLSEAGMMGHVVPDHGELVTKGIGQLIQEIKMNAQVATLDQDQKEFYNSALSSLEGVQMYMTNFADLAMKISYEDNLPKNQVDSLRQIHERLNRLSVQPPVTFTDAVQLLFSFHCCLHNIGEPVALGRLDQILLPFLDKTNPEDAPPQDVIDAFCLKLSERVEMNRHFIKDLVYPGVTAVFYQTTGNFPQGGGINQWVQQVTLGGYKATDETAPSPGINELTLKFLKATRRLPLNAPCFSLRLYKGIESTKLGQDIIEETAKALLSGGAHPIIFNDDRMVPGLQSSGVDPYQVPLSAARDYACDGCYEPMVTGASEFAFITVPLLNIVEMAINEGTLYKKAGPVFLRGAKSSYKTKPPEEIKDFKELMAIFGRHLHLQIVNSCLLMLQNYGNLWKWCPSSLLSTIIRGCKESGRDLSNGGALHHILAIMFVGASNAIDSLYRIKQMVFNPTTAITDLEDLVTCLKCDWGYDMKEPMQDIRAGSTRSMAHGEKYKRYRQVAMSFPRFGEGVDDIDQLGHEVMKMVHDEVRNVVSSAPVKTRMEELKQKFNLSGFIFTPGVGTFEGYVGAGLDNGASADGRRSGQPICSDFSPSPNPQDLPAAPISRYIYNGLKSWNNEVINKGFSNGAPVDLNITEGTSASMLENFIKDFANERNGIGSNLLTISCHDPDTLTAAHDDPERYELVRCRQGGWTEYFSIMFPEHQKHHQRRIYFDGIKRDVGESRHLHTKLQYGDDDDLENDMVDALL